MRLSPWIASRYLFSRNLSRFSRLITATAITSVAIGTLSLIVVMSVMRGFRSELADRLVGFDAHITLSAARGAQGLGKSDLDGLLAGLDVRSVYPFAEGDVIAQSESAGEVVAQGARVRGFDPENEATFAGVDLKWSEIESPSGLPRAVIGSEIVSQLAVHPDFGDEIELTAPLAEVGPTGELGPSSRRFMVGGVLRSGIFDYDSKYIFVPIEEARRFLGEQTREGWKIELADGADAGRAVDLIAGRLPAGWEVRGWHDTNRKLFAALKLERMAMGAVFLMVMVIGSFSTVGAVLLVTSAKRKDMAILSSLGQTHRSIRHIFLFYAAQIGTIGSGVGLTVGLVVCGLLDRFPIRLPSSYYIDWLPVELNPFIAVLFACIGVVVAVLSSIYPVSQTMRKSPAEALRYE